MLDAEYMIGYALSTTRQNMALLRIWCGGVWDGDSLARLSKYDRGWAHGALHVVEYGMEHDPIQLMAARNEIRFLIEDYLHETTH